MPIISMFYGIIIRMYTGLKEHNPPHIHALYQGLEAVYDIRTAEKIKGDMPSNQSKLISAWIVLHEEELMADWELAQSNESIYKIRPLR